PWTRSRRASASTACPSPTGRRSTSARRRRSSWPRSRPRRSAMAEHRLRRMLLWGALAVLAVYLALCALLYVQQRRLIYYPQFTRVAVDQTDFAITRPDAVLRGWVVNPGHRDAVLYFGGNAEAVDAHRGAFAQ